MATIADVARAAGVSIATVSRVLSPGAVPHPVRAATAERVRVVARELNFIPSPLAQGLAVGRTGLIGLVVPDLADPHYPHIAGGVEEGARDARLAVLICNTLGEQQRLTEYLLLLQARRVDAIVLSGGASLNALELLVVQACQVPVVLIGRPTIDMPWPHVTIDNHAGARQATRHLVEAGARRIVHLGGPQSQTTMADRADGYREVVDAANMGADEVTSDGTPEDGYMRLKVRLGDRSLPAANAVFAATDRLAVAALAVAADLHLRVPRDLAVIGFDDIPLAAQLRPTLSSMAQPAHELGQIAIAMGQRLAAGETVPSAVLQTRLVPRQSTLGSGGEYTRGAEVDSASGARG